MCATRASARVVQKTQPRRPYTFGASRFHKKSLPLWFYFFINANLRRIVKKKPTLSVPFEKILPWKLQFSVISVDYMIYFRRLLIDKTHLNLTVIYALCMNGRRRDAKAETNSVKTIRFQVENVMHALYEIFETSDHYIWNAFIVEKMGKFLIFISLFIWY